MQKPDNTLLFSELEKFLVSIYPFEQDELEKIKSAFYIQKFRKGEYFFKSDEKEQKWGILLRGSSRNIKFKNNQDVTKRLVMAPAMIAQLRNYLTQSGTDEAVEFLEDSIVMSMPYNMDRKLIREFHSYSIFRLIGVQKGLLELSSLIEMLLCNDAKERYVYILKNNPEFVQYLPLKHLASLLGITPYSLSRIRRNLD